MQNSSRGIKRRVGTALALAAMLGLVGVIPAQAATVALAGTAHNYKTYHSAPRYKAVTGTAKFTPSATFVDNCGSGGRWSIGFRQVTGAGEITQFPATYVSGPQVQFRNVGAPPVALYTFGVGTYYFNSQIGCGAGGAADWSGTLYW